MTSLNETHDPALRSWVDSANPASSDFPIQNRPFAVFRRQSSNEAFRGGMAIGDQILDLAAVASAGGFSDEAAPAVQAQLAACLVPQSGAEYGVPARIGDYTDYYTSVHHATSIVVSGQAFSRSLGQTLPPGTTQPIFGPSKRLDMELERGIFVVTGTGTGNALGEAVAMA
jgi:fumarylacetoacetase